MYLLETILQYNLLELLNFFKSPITEQDKIMLYLIISPYLNC